MAGSISGQDLPLVFADRDGLERSASARTRNALPGVGLEHRAVMGADQPTLAVGEEPVGREIQRSALVRTDVEPGHRLPLASGQDQVLWRLFGAGQAGFQELAFLQLIGKAQERF